ncbi:MAG: hypothetical protein WD187_01200 [Candidatus Woykebacteria bacterium]
MFRNSEKGQTLIEAVVTLGVALVIIGSIVSLVNASNRRATLSRQATQASKLSQEGMEIVRNIRDVGNDQAVRVDNTGTCSDASPCSWGDLYGNKQFTFTAYLQEPGSAGCPIMESWCLSSVGEPPLLTIFTRQVEISDDEFTDSDGDTNICAEAVGGTSLGSDEIKRVTVAVGWDSPVGNQTRRNISCIANWR